MTDEELLSLILTRKSSDWTPVEVQTVQNRCEHSPQLQNALLDRLRQDGFDAENFENAIIVLQNLSHRTANPSNRQSRPARIGLMWFVIAIVIVTAIGIGISQIGNRLPRQSDLPLKPEVAENNSPNEISALSSPASNPAEQSPEIPATSPAESVSTESSDLPQADSTEIHPALTEAVNEPWSQAYAPDTPIWKSNAAKLFRSEHAAFPEQDARRWWNSVHGQNQTWKEESVGGKPVSAFQGWAKLRLPWRDNTLWRITLLDAESCELLFWKGTSGVSLRYFPQHEPVIWVANQVVRDDVASSDFRSTEFLATDHGAFFRSSPGTFDLQVCRGDLVFSRGGIPLLAAPLGGLPDEVLLTGACRFQGMSVHQCEPLFAPTSPAESNGSDHLERASDWNWQPVAEVSPLKMEVLDPGRIQFSAEAGDRPAMLSAALPRRGLWEVLFEIEQADVGTAISLGSKTGRPLASLAVVRDVATSGTAFDIVLPDAKHPNSNFDEARAPVAWFDHHAWIRLVSGLGSFQAWISTDGKRWAHLPIPAVRVEEEPVETIGVIGLPGFEPRSLALGQLSARELTGITAFADRSLIDQVPAFTRDEFHDILLWNQRVLTSQPKDIDKNRWRNTCLVVTLEQCASREVCTCLLNELLQWTSESDDVETDRFLALLYDTMLLLDVWDEQPLREVADALQAIGLRELDRGKSRPSVKLRESWLQLPIWTHATESSLFERLMIREATAAALQGDWTTAKRIILETRFWSTPVSMTDSLTGTKSPSELLGQWILGTSSERETDRSATEPVLPKSWRHPYVPQFNRESYTLLADIKTAIENHHEAEACRLVTSLNPQLCEGLLPDPHDPELLISLPAAIRSLQQEHADFLAAMSQEPSQTGLIRVHKAIAENRESILSAAVIQYPGTPAAAEAHRWLGDQRLAVGKVLEATTHYRLALDSATPEQIEELQTRIELSQVWSGQPTSPPANKFPNAGIKLNEYRLSAAEFSALLEETQPISSRNTKSRHPLPNPGTYEWNVLTDLSGDIGSNTEQPRIRPGDPYGKQFSLVADDQQIYVSNRFQVTAVDVLSGKVQWTQGVGSNQGAMWKFPFIPMRPLVHGDVLYVRRLTQTGAELCCLKKADGSLVWKQQPTSHVLTDPLLWQGELCALMGGKTDDGLLQVELGKFDVQTGQVRFRKPLAQFHDNWLQEIPCQWAVHESLAICQMGSVIAGVTLTGEHQWLRKPASLPEPVDDLIWDHRVTEPVVRGDHVLVSAPGTRAVEAIDFASGRLIWRTALPNLRGIRGISETHILVDVGEALIGLENATGKIVWRHHVQNLLEGFAMDDQTILYAQRDQSSNPRINLVWLNVATGKEVARSPLDSREQNLWQLGPWIRTQDRWWSLGATSLDDPHRKIGNLANPAEVPTE